jgi:hypothetical protein
MDCARQNEHDDLMSDWKPEFRFAFTRRFATPFAGAAAG